MAVLADAIEEFKKMPTGGKIAVGVGAVAVAGIAIYLKMRSVSTGTSTLSASGAAQGLGNLPPTDTSGSSANQPPSSTGTPTGTPPPDVTGGNQAPPTIPTGNPPTTSPQPKLQTYTVQRGDNLSEIANKLHIRGGWQALYNQNKDVIGANPNLVFSGKVLNISGLT